MEDLLFESQFLRVITVYSDRVTEASRLVIRVGYDDIVVLFEVHQLESSPIKMKSAI